MNRLIFLLASTLPVAAQTASTITFYTPGGYFRGAGKSAVTMGIGKDDPAPSQARLYEGDEKLALLTPGRYLTIEAAPGRHAFGVRTGNKPQPEGGDLMLNVEAGKQYFVQMTVTGSGASFIKLFRGHLTLMSCAEARNEADGTKPAQVRLIEKPTRSKVVDSSYFPKCQDIAPTSTGAVQR